MSAKNFIPGDYAVCRCQQCVENNRSIVYKIKDINCGTCRADDITTGVTAVCLFIKYLVPVSEEDAILSMIKK